MALKCNQDLEMCHMRPKICIKGRLIISSKFFTFLEEGGGSRLMMTKCDMGVGRSKFLIL